MKHLINLLVFGVPNAKYLTFSTPDGNALVCKNAKVLAFHTQYAKIPTTSNVSNSKKFSVNLKCNGIVKKAKIFILFYIVGVFF